jgi:hypothetical protein
MREENRVDFYYHHYYKEKKIKLIVIEFINYTII